MKLELNLNIKLLVVQFPTDKLFIENHAFFSVIKIASFEEHVVQFICKGSELTEDIAKGLVNREVIEGVETYMQYDCTCNNYFDEDITALESFISSIEASGYHWGENPEPSHYDYSNDDCETDFAQYYLDHDKWQEAESRTFYPEKCIICEIL